LRIDFSNIDVLVHLAYDLRTGRSDTNYSGTVRLLKAARANKVARQLLVSSYSARPDATSEYGRTKHRLEQAFRDHGYEILRPGLVLGNGGIVARIVKSVKTLPVIPLPSGGTGEVPFISIAALCEAVKTIVASRQGTEYNLFAQHFTSLSLLVRAIHSAVCRRPRILTVPMPAPLLLSALQLMEACRLPLPLKADNLKGFLGNQARVHESSLDALGLKSETLLEAVVAASLA
jgi:NADH dehydrogenase